MRAGADRRAQPGRLPHPARRVLPARPRPGSPTSWRRCTWPPGSCGSRGPPRRCGSWGATRPASRRAPTAAGAPAPMARLLAAGRRRRRAAPLALPAVEVPTDERLTALFAGLVDRRPGPLRLRRAPAGVAAAAPAVQPAGRRASERLVDPHRLDFQRGRWYLSGHDHGRDDLRSFRVDRIAGPVEVLRRATLPPARPAPSGRPAAAVGAGRRGAGRRPGCWSTPTRPPGPSSTSAPTRSRSGGPTARWC